MLGIFLQKYLIKVLALLLSLGTHLVVVYVLGSTAHVVKGAAPVRSASSNLVIELLRKSNDWLEGNEFEQPPRWEKVAATASDNTGEGPQTDVQAENSDTSVLPVATPPVPYYFLPEELTENAYVVIDISPDLASLMPNDVSSLAVLNLMINEYGDIDQVIMENSELPEQAQEAVISAFEGTRFEPGKVDGIAVKSQLKIEVLLESIEVKEIRRIDFSPKLDEKLRQ